jgi:hypothetical protein
VLVDEETELARDLAEVTIVTFLKSADAVVPQQRRLLLEGGQQLGEIPTDASGLRHSAHPILLGAGPGGELNARALPTTRPELSLGLAGARCLVAISSSATPRTHTGPRTRLEKTSKTHEHQGRTAGTGR